MKVISNQHNVQAGTQNYSPETENMMSPRKKKPKLLSPQMLNIMKRECEADEFDHKRKLVVTNEEDEHKARKKKNFIEACKQVSCSAYLDYHARLLLIYFPSCLNTSICKHLDKNGTNIKQMPPYAEESFIIEMKNNMWYDALEVCQMCITPVQYLSADVLKGVVEIMLNAHEDEFSEYSVSHIIDKCQQILAQNFSTHPPCPVKSLRTCYNNFLTSPMSLKEKTFTNRTQFECSKGIVKYCLNRLDYEISADSIDGPLINKYENIPEEMRQTVRGLHWQKETFEIFELLSRTDRIERLMAVLESVIELLQFDLAIWLARYTHNLCRHIMRSHKPLMAVVLWSDNILYTGAVTSNCRQILRLFAYLVHLQYPDSMLRIITAWLNTMIQTFYICETNSNSDYPNTAKYCTVFAKEFYKIISGMPHDSIIRILERIEPAFMRHLLGILHLQKLLPTDDNCIMRILINFVKEAQWKSYPSDNTGITISKKLFFKPKKKKNIISYLLKKCESWTPETEEKIQYSKIEEKTLSDMPNVTVKHVVHCIYVTLEAYLDTYNVQCVQETWNKLNEQMFVDDETQSQSSLLRQGSYVVTEEFIKKYRYIIKTVNELETVFHNLSSSGEMPEIMNIFTKIAQLDL